MSARPLGRWTGALSAAAVSHLAVAWLILAEMPDAAGGGTAGAGISLALAGGPPMSATAQPGTPSAAAPVQPPDAQPAHTDAPAEPTPPRDAEAVLDERPAETVDPNAADRSPIAPASVAPVELSEAPEIDDAPARDAVAVAPPETPREAPEPTPAIEAVVEPEVRPEIAALDTSVELPRDAPEPPPAAETVVEPEVRPEIAVPDTPSPDLPLAASLPPPAVTTDPPPAPPAWVSEQVPLPPLPPRIPENVPERPPQPQLAQASVRPPAAPEQPAPAQPAPANTVAQESDVEQASLPLTGEGGASAAVDDGGGGSGISPDAAAASADAQAGYVATLQAYLTRYKRYPSLARSRNQEGVVMLYFAVDRQGALIEARINGSSGHRQLDQAALDMVNRAAPFPPMPAEMLQSRLELIVPVEFWLN